MVTFGWKRRRRRVGAGAMRIALASVSAFAALAAFTATSPVPAAAASFRARIEAPDRSPVPDAVVELQALDPSGRPVPAARPAAPPKATMDQIGLAFVPHVLAVRVGTVVDFPNSDQVRHSIYSFSAARTFEVKLYRGFEAPPITFDRTGLVVLGCNIHDQMLGFVYVLDSPHFAISDEQGALEIGGLPPGRYRLSLRHPRLEESRLLEREIVLPADASLVLTLAERPPPRPAPPRDVDPLQSLFGEGAR